MVLGIAYIIPGSPGSPTAPHNLVVACRACRSRKGTQIWVSRNLDRVTTAIPAWAAQIRARASPSQPPPVPEPAVAARWARWSQELARGRADRVAGEDRLTEVLDTLTAGLTADEGVIRKFGVFRARAAGLMEVAHAIVDGVIPLDNAQAQ